MRLGLVMALAIVFGCTAGIGMTWYELGNVVENFESAAQPKVSTAISNVISASDIGSPRTVVEGGFKFEFGSMAHQATAQRAFLVRNEGDKTLKLDFDYASCGNCIEVADAYKNIVIPPGESREVVVTYNARKDGPKFQESAHYKTNDPSLPAMELIVAGVITKPIRLIPEELAFGTISFSDGAAGKVIVLGYHSPKIEVLSHKFSNKWMDNQLEVSVTPLPTEKVLEKDQHATCGLEIQFTAKSGLPLGLINETATLQIRAEAEHNIEIRITGEVVGDITVIGKNYSAERGVLSLGLMKQGQGGTFTLYMLVKGPYRKDVKLSTGEHDPPNTFDVRIGDGTPLADGRAIKFPITIEVSKSAPTQTRMGDVRGPLGKIVIETTHPGVKQVPISVRYVIE